MPTSAERDRDHRRATRLEPAIADPARRERAHRAGEREDRDLERREQHARAVQLLEVTRRPVEEAVADDVEAEEREREHPDPPVREREAERLAERGRTTSPAASFSRESTDGASPSRGLLAHAERRMHAERARAACAGTMNAARQSFENVVTSAPEATIVIAEPSW